MARELIIVRHGQAVTNVDGVLAGPACPGLTTLGHYQAELVASRLAAEHRTVRSITSMYVSTTLRAAQTGAAIGQLLGLNATPDPELRVPDPGPADGRPWSDVRARWPPDPDHPSRPLIDGGESWAAYTARTHSRLRSIMTEPASTDDCVLLVAHAETVRSTFELLLNSRSLATMTVCTDNTGITRWQLVRTRLDATTGQRWALVKHNDTAHLPA